MAKNRTFTGGRRSAATPTLSKESYFQMIRMIRNAKKEGEKDGRKDDHDTRESN